MIESIEVPLHLIYEKELDDYDYRLEGNIAGQLGAFTNYEAESIIRNKLIRKNESLSDSLIFDSTQDKFVAKANTLETVMSLEKFIIELATNIENN